MVEEHHEQHPRNECKSCPACRSQHHPCQCRSGGRNGPLVCVPSRRGFVWIHRSRFHVSFSVTVNAALSDERLPLPGTASGLSICKRAMPSAGARNCSVTFPRRCVLYLDQHVLRVAGSIRPFRTRNRSKRNMHGLLE